MTARPRRVAVTRQTVRAPHPGATFRAVTEIDDETELGDLYMRSLMGAQLRLGLVVCLSVCGALAVLPIAFELFPALGAASLLGLRLPWLLLGVVVFPTLVAGGWVYVRRAERNERRFVAEVEHP
jgi:hypothetical protein